MQITNNMVIELANNLGFELVGFAKAEKLSDEITNLKSWLDKKYHSGMAYMERNLDKREDAKLILENVQSVISLGMNYYCDDEYSEDKKFGKVSRYAWGKDYHLIIWQKLDEFVELLKENDPEFQAKTYVDTGPVMDKTWAVRAGLGWIGKHTNVINKNIGSWFFIATIFTNYKFDCSLIEADLCGTCTACINACPTQAIVDEYVVDANKCISYLTIENKGEISVEFKDKFDRWIFGCDICQDVCPWNIKFAEDTYVTEFIRRKENKELLIEEIYSMDNRQFKERFHDSPLIRAKLKGLKRNAEFIIKS